MDSVIRARVSEEQYRFLTEHARAHRTNKSWVVRLAIDSLMAAQTPAPFLSDTSTMRSANGYTKHQAEVSA